MPFETNTGFRAYTGNNFIRLINYSSEPLTKIKLLVKELNLDIIEYMIIRERGILTFNTPLEFIELGTLYPDESAEIRYTPDPGLIDSNASLFVLNHLKINYSLITEASITTTLNALITSTN